MNDLLGIVILALCSVESGNNPAAIGDHGRAVGILQVHAECVRDVNRIVGEKWYTLEDRYNPAKSKEMARIYLNYYCSKERLGRPATAEDYARTWNGGPRYNKKTTNGYWHKVKTVLGR